MQADWHYVKNGKQQGPVAFEVLQRLAASGELKENDEVWWQGSEFDWIAARNVPALFSKAVEIAKEGNEDDSLPTVVHSLNEKDESDI